MSALKSLPPFPRPSRADRTLLPAALAALLAVSVVALLVLPTALELPEAGLVAPLRLPPLIVATAPADPSIAARTLFTPTRSDSGVARPGATPTVAPLPLGGARIVGTSSVGGRARVFVEATNGKVRALGLGSVYLGWRLSRVGSDSVEFGRGGQRLRLTVGAAAAAPAATEAASEEEPQ